MPLVQAVCSVLYLQASVLAMLDILEQLVISVTPTTTEQVVELAEVSVTLWKYVLHCFFKCTYFQPVVAMPLVQEVCSVLILRAPVLAKLDTQEKLVMPVPPNTTEQEAEHAQVSITLRKYVLQCFFKCTYSQPVVAISLVQEVCSVLIL